jgi:hypothetical protein
MKTRICNQCGKEKLLSEFHKDKYNKAGFCVYCKECVFNYNKEYNKTHIKERKIYNKNYLIINRKQINIQRKIHNKQVPWIKILASIKDRCDNPNHKFYKDYGGRGIKNCFKNYDEVKFLWFRDNAYKMKRPSINRKDNDGNYCIENCEFIEQSRNTKQMLKDNNLYKSVVQFTKQGEFIKNWETMSMASKTLNIWISNISSSCLGKVKSAGGFIWKFKN